jgi:hypothetical protein
MRSEFPTEKTMIEHPCDGGMSVVDRDGTHVATVDKVEGGHLKILRPDQRPRNPNTLRRIGSSLLMTEYV